MRTMFKKRPPKQNTQKLHAERRFRERFGVKLTQYLWDNILHQIHSGKASFFKKQSLRVSIFDVDIVLREQEVEDSQKAKVGPLTVRIVYDGHRKTLVSALTLDMDIDALKMDMDDTVIVL